MIPELAKHTEKLFYFFEVANIGSLQASARKLGVSAPTLSYSIKCLEEISGVKLFNRSKMGVTLTEAGERLLTFCRKFYRELEEVENLLINPTETPLTRVKVGTFQSIAIYFWPFLLDALKEDPNLSISIMTNRSQTVLEALHRRDVDIALTVEAGEQVNLIRHELYKDDYAVFASKSAPKTKFSRDQLRKISFMYIPDARDQNGITLRQHLHSWGVSFKEEFELDSFEVITEFITRNYGIGILPSKVAKTYSDRLKKVRLEGMQTARFGTHRFFLSYRDDLELPQSLMNHFLESAKLAVGQMSR